jgi:GT2 family glycosyltransferase
MNVAAKKKIVLLGMMTKMPVPGVVWQYVHYLVGFQRLGYDVYYVEQHARTPSMFMETEQSDGSTRAATFLDRIMQRLNLGDAWTYQALHENEDCFGLSHARLQQLFGSAELIINMHGGTEPLPEHSATGRLVYLETDPVQLQIELHRKRQSTTDFLKHHCAFFTFGENIGNPDCALPTPKQFHFLPTRQPVVIEFWSDKVTSERNVFTTVANWHQTWRTVKLRGEKYTWSKDIEFFKFVDLPSRTSQHFELALAGCPEKEKQILERHGWKTREAADFSADIDAYQQYIASSRGEFTVAKDQNVRLRSGWFSDRSATYLACGRPVVTQETGFSNILPTGCGLYGFSNVDEAVHAFEEIDRDYEKNRHCAREIACEYFDSNVVLARLLRDAGVSTPQHRPKPFPKSMVLEPTARRPLKLAPATLHAANSNAVRAVKPADEKSMANVSIVVVTFDNFVLTRLCLETLLAHTGDCEIVVVDNASSDGTIDYLRELSARNRRVRPVFNAQNLGFARASNQGIAAASGDVFVLLNNDALVPPGWLPRLIHHLEGENLGAVGPVTNRIGNEAQVDVACRTYGDFLDVASRLADARAGTAFDIPTLTMFCFAIRRRVFEQVGQIDERFAVGTLEDDDYSLRLRQAGFRLLCAEDVFVYHFGEASFGKLVSDGSYARLLLENKRRFEQKWSRPWKAYGRKIGAKYQAEREAIRRSVMEKVPAGRTVAIATRGDAELLKIPDRCAWHFPRNERGEFAGCYPRNGTDAVKAVKELSAIGAQYLAFPASGFWWLDYYGELRTYCRTECDLIAEEPGHCLIFALPPAPATTAVLPAQGQTRDSFQTSSLSQEV